MHRTAMAARAVGLALLVALLTSCYLLPVEGPAPLRYRDEVFASVTKTSNVSYATATLRTGGTANLLLDVYRPTGDTVSARPLIIWVHGGSFKGGSKTSPELVDQATVFAKKGYVNASISYRLSSVGCTDPLNNAAECVESIHDAIEDAQSAVRFFRANAATYGVDPDRISIAGTSAGAITALGVGYQVTIPAPASNTSNSGFSSSVDSAVSLSGAVIFTGDVGPGDAPALLFHGTTDNLVPYAWAQSTVTEADADGLWAALITWEGEGHVPYSAHRTEIIENTTNFVYRTQGNSTAPT